jgi:hypothetical protein
MKPDIGEQHSETVETTIYAIQVAHVIFSISELSEIEGGKNFKVYSETKQEGRRFIAETFDLDHAGRIVDGEAALLEKKLEQLRHGLPTPKQLMFLFSQKIPIPPTLTWGEASDIIDKRMRQITIEREARRQEKEEIRRKKEELKQKVLDPPYHPGEKVLHPLHGIGIVLHAGYEFAGVQFQNEKKMVKVTELIASQSEEEQP